MKNRNILLVEDEPILAEVVCDYLTSEGYGYRWAKTGKEAAAAFAERRPDLVLLDLMLPDVDGVEVFKRIREQSAVPVIMVTARSEESNRFLGLQLGADDYVCKPFSPRELVARVGAVLRRVQSTIPCMSPLELLENGTTALVRGRRVELTVAEHRLLRVLSQAPQQVFSRQKLLDYIYDDHRDVTDRTIDTHVKNIRRKLLDAGAMEDWIKTVYGAGYRLEMSLILNNT